MTHGNGFSHFCAVLRTDITNRDTCYARQGEARCRGCKSRARMCEKCKQNDVQYPADGLCERCHAEAALLGEQLKQPEDYYLCLRTGHDAEDEELPAEATENRKKRKQSVPNQSVWRRPSSEYLSDQLYAYLRARRADTIPVTGYFKGAGRVCAETIKCEVERCLGRYAPRLTPFFICVLMLEAGYNANELASFLEVPKWQANAIVRESIDFFAANRTVTAPRTRSYSSYSEVLSALREIVARGWPDRWDRKVLTLVQRAQH